MGRCAISSGGRSYSSSELSIRPRRYLRVMEGTGLGADVTAALERARLQVEALAQTAEELQNVLPETVGTALSEGLRTEAAPLARRLAEVKGLVNGTIRRLERLETDVLAERDARVVDLVTGGWRSINERLDAIEAAVAPPERTLVELRAAASA